MASETELEAMIVRIIGDASGYQQMLKEAATDSKKMVDDLKDLSKQAKKTGNSFKDFASQTASALGALAIGDFLKNAKEEWQQAELAEVKLTAAVKANKREVEDTMGVYKEYASAIQKATVHSDENVFALLKLAEAYDQTGDEATKMVDKALALAAAAETSPEAAMKMVNAMAKGNTELAMGMARMFPMLREFKDEAEFTEKFQQMLASGAEQMGAIAATGWGKAQIGANAYSDALEEVGRIFSEFLNPLKKARKAIVELFMGLPEEGKVAVVTLATVTAGILAIGPTVAMLTPVWTAVTGGIGMVVTGLTAVKTALMSITAYNVGAFLSSSFAMAKTAITSFTLAALANPFVWIGMAVAGFAALTIAIIRSSDAYKQYQQGLKDTKELAEKNKQIGEGRIQDTLKEVEEAPGEDKIKMLEKQIALEKDLVKWSQEAVDRSVAAKNELQERAGNELGGMGGPIGQLIDPRMKVLDETLQATRKNLDVAKVGLGTLEAQLKKLKDADGMSPQMVKDLRDFNKELEKTVRQSNMTDKEKKLDDMIEKGAKGPAAARARELVETLKLIEEQKKKQEQALQGTKQVSNSTKEFVKSTEGGIAALAKGDEGIAKLDELRRSVDEARTKLTEAGLSAEQLRKGMENLKEAERNLANAEGVAHMMRFGEAAKKLREELESKNPVMKYSSEIKRFKELLALGLPVDQLQESFKEVNDQFKEGLGITKLPAEKYQEKLKLLDDALREGFITQKEYARGVNLAGAELDKAAESAGKFDQALAGSAEAYSRIQEFNEKLNTKRPERRPGSDAADKFEAVQRAGAEGKQRDEKQVNKLEDIRKLLQKQADKPVIVVEGANLGG